MLDPRLIVGYRILLALLGFSAIVTEIATLVERGVFTPANFFSFFTIQSNILVVVTLLLSAVALAAGDRDRFAALRAAVTVYILVVGIGFSLLLSNLQGVELTAVPWDNTVLHYIVPVAMLVDYLLDRPRRRLPFRASLLWLLYPLAYAAYSLIRGAIVGWYPYPFLDPETNGAGAVAVTVLGLIVLGVALIWVITRLSGRDPEGAGDGTTDGPSSTTAAALSATGGTSTGNSAGESAGTSAGAISSPAADPNTLSDTPQRP